MTEYAVKPGGTPTWVRDATPNDSDKTFTVPAGKMWDMRLAVMELQATATVGNRYIAIVISNAAPAVLLPATTVVAGVAPAGFGNATIYFGNAAVGNATSTYVSRFSSPTTTASPVITAYLPELILLPGYSIRMYDVSAIDPAADDMIAVLHYIEYEA